jgi:hypothetical protein
VAEITVDQAIDSWEDLQVSVFPANAVPAPEPAKSPVAASVPKLQAPPPIEVAADVPVPIIDAEDCMETIWEQLIAAPPERGRSMTTVTCHGSRVLLSSWEVTAFVSESGATSEDLRNAVVARALVTIGLEYFKKSGKDAPLRAALVLARKEAIRVQEQADKAKRAKDTDAAVNLGITAKRLRTAIEEAEKR